MVHLKYPICHEHITHLPPLRLKFDTKLRKVFPNNLAAQLCTSHSRRENIAPNFVCSFQPIKFKHLKLRFSATFCTCYSSQLPCSRLKSGKKLRNMSPSRFVSTALHKSLLQAKYGEYCMSILSVCSGQSNACIQNQDFGYTLVIVLLLKFIL